jgi:tRNA A58 N-methylase Trm61
MTVFQRLQRNIEVSDEEFDSIYPKQMRAVSEFHFTPVAVAKVAARFLVQKEGTKVLDVGAGAGKFCMIGAVCTAGHFTGVEQRAGLHHLAEQLSKRYKLSNLNLVHSNITAVAFKGYDAAYVFNPFYENIITLNPIDSTVFLDKTLYSLYSFYVKQQLNTMPVGTRLATYFSYLDEVPESYAVQSTDFDDKLKLWTKTI